MWGAESAGSVPRGVRDIISLGLSKIPELRCTVEGVWCALQAEYMAALRGDDVNTETMSATDNLYNLE